MLMTAQKVNKLQEYALKVGIENESQLRTLLSKRGVGSATSYKIWHNGITKAQDLDLIEALEEILKAPKEKFLE